MCRAIDRAVRAAVVLGAAAWAGCAKQEQPPPIGYYLNSRGDLQRLYRVVFVELPCEAEEPAVAEDLTDAIAQAVQGKRLFRVDVLRRGDPNCQRLSLDAKEPLTLKQIAALREALRCDAVLFGSVSSFQPYPRLAVGLSLRLVDLKNGQLVWGVDHVWDTTDRCLEPRMEKYFQRNVRSGYEPIDWRLTATSPRAFAKFIAYEVAATMPGRDAGNE